MNLLDNQTKAIKHLSKYKIGAFFMEAGSGKTRTVVEILNQIIVDEILYIAPYRTLNGNKKETIQYQVDLFGGFNANVKYIAIESIQSSNRIYLDCYNYLESSNGCAIVLDESLKIKNKDAKRTKRALELSKLAEYKFILNGTPISRNYLDLKCQMDFLSPKILDMSDIQYKNTFCEYKEVKITKGSSTRKKEYIVDYHNLDVLHKMIKPFVFFSELSLDVGLKHIDLKYNLSDDEIKYHEYTKNKILDNEWLMAKPNFFLSLTQKLQNNYSRNKSKFDIIKPLICKKTVIVAKFIETQYLLKKKFPNTRILSWQKDSFGLNLQEYNKMIIFDKHWDYALYDQMIRRIYRTGQKNECIIYSLTAKVGLDDIIQKSVDKKEQLLNNYKKISKDEL